jgi:ubiquitin-like protein Pup
MAERTQKSKITGERTADATTDTGVDVAASTATGDKLIAELDDLLDEIDEVLESNAEEFVKSYVQKGGQ